MSQDMDAREGHAIPGMVARTATLQMRGERFDLMTRVIGCESEAARARLIGMDVRTLRRARQGIIGEVFVASTVAALRRHGRTLAQYGLEPSLDDLFEVVELAGERAA